VTGSRSIRSTAVGTLIGIVVGIVVALAASAPAFADPAGPTDYRSEVIEIAPPTPEIEVRVVGGDSFVELTVEPGVEVLVVGYQGEPYLRFDPDGSIWENRRSPATYLNEERYGNEFPPEADPDADPEWERVGGGGSFAWHDHRAHWMQPQPPAGGPGDRILEGVIPLFVDGTEVDVTVVSTWQEPASRVPIYAAIVVALGSVGLGWLLLRRESLLWTVTAVPVALLAVVAGVLQFRSLPASTEPRLVWVLLPMLALAAAVVAVVAGRLGRDFVATGAILVAGVELAMWGGVKRDGLTAALIPSDAPGWLDRFATTLALVTGIGLALLALWDLFGRTVPSRRAGDGSDGGGVSATRAAPG
jgi:hypothetical protein